ncbi:hypothetical protein DM01DRAFT_1367792 [Hesseltinella vesiculosa]|uniref:Small ribosomal subunit protein mS35 mitochondrial conserved domain-containing protein n=1 Tax=Hesseltinella vesiculosa TaxID=101127 RepID=A0A1X2GD45_9FUNG|nr:hypothetical protein DM01DRAFT_1367792 [Hesseltinella vesiculosa]
MLATTLKSRVSLNAVRSFTSTSAALAGRQSRFRKPERKFDVENMEEFKFDDQTTMGHSLFENIREVRQYLRKTQYELPKLSVYAKPFEAPKGDVIVTYKTQNYPGEGHPVERKVVLSLKVKDLRLTAVQQHKFLLLAGPRYHVDTDELIISSEKFPHRKQNKKHVNDLLQSLLKEAKDETDTFADVPLNLRKPKQRLEFPKEWARPQEQKQQE